MKYIAFLAIFAALIVAGCDATTGAGNTGLMVPGQTYDAVNMSRMPGRVTFRPDGIVTVYEPGEAEPEQQRWSRRNAQICIDDMAEAVEDREDSLCLDERGTDTEGGFALANKDGVMIFQPAAD